MAEMGEDLSAGNRPLENPARVTVYARTVVPYYTIGVVADVLMIVITGIGAIVLLVALLPMLTFLIALGTFPRIPRRIWLGPSEVKFEGMSGRPGFRRSPGIDLQVPYREILKVRTNLGVGAVVKGSGRLTQVVFLTRANANQLAVRVRRAKAQRLPG